MVEGGQGVEENPCPIAPLYGHERVDIGLKLWIGLPHRIEENTKALGSEFWKEYVPPSSASAQPQTRIQTLLRRLDSDGSGSAIDLKRELSLRDEPSLSDEDPIICDGKTKSSASALRKYVVSWVEFQGCDYIEFDPTARTRMKDIDKLKKALSLYDEYTWFDEAPSISEGKTKSLSAMRTPATPPKPIAGRPSSESWKDFILYLDSGASGNAVFNAEMLINRRDPPAGMNQFMGADGSRMAVIGFGDIKMENIRIPDVYLVQGLTVNLISVGQLASNHKVCCCFSGNECNLMLSDGSRIGGAIRCDDNQYMLRFLQIE
jgi:hypothetical protein